MEPPKELRRAPGPWRTPPGYIDVTCLHDKEAVFIAGPNHPYYLLEDKIINVLAPIWPLIKTGEVTITQVTAKIMEAI